MKLIEKGFDLAEVNEFGLKKSALSKFWILKATVEYLAKFGEDLFNLALKEAKKFIKFARDMSTDLLTTS